MRCAPHRERSSLPLLSPKERILVCHSVDVLALVVFLLFGSRICNRNHPTWDQAEGPPKTILAYLADKVESAGSRMERP